MLWKIICCSILLNNMIASKPLENSIKSSNGLEKNEIFQSNDTRSELNLKNGNARQSLPVINNNNTTNNPDNSTNIWTGINLFSTLIQSLIKKLQLTPQGIIFDRLNSLKEILLNLNSTEAKTLSELNSLLSYLGDHGFYTNRLDPAGFFSGNGWFANKGGLLGGPGAIFSTGSLLTDYQSSY